MRPAGNSMGAWMRGSAIAVDLGTASIRARGATGGGIRPAALDGRRALVGGVVADHEAAVAILRPLLRAARGWTLRQPRVLACVPTDADVMERAAVADCVRRAGAGAVRLVPEPLAAAVGAGVDLSSPFATLIVDLGEGVTDAAVVADGTIVAASARRGGCAELRAGLINERVASSEAEAEDALRRGGLAAVASRVDAQLSIVTRILADLPPRRACEVIESGILVSGGGALIPGVPERLAILTGLAVRRAPDPLGSVVRGAAAMLPVAERSDLWRDA